MTKQRTGRRVILAALSLVLVCGVALGDVYDDIVNYDWDKSRKTPATIEQEIRDADTPAERKAIEAKLIRVLNSGKGTYACNQFICRALRRVGSDACVPALAKLLKDPKLSHMARFALQRNSSPEAGEALRQAMRKLSGELKLGMMTSVGQRADTQAVAELAKYTRSNNETLVTVALKALGQIGDPAAAKALNAAKVPRKLRTLLADARLKCADKLLADGEDAAAASVYRKLFSKGNTKMIRIAALRGIVMSEKAKAVDTLLPLLDSDDPDLSRAAKKYVVALPGKEATRALAAKLPSMGPKAQARLISALTERGDSAAAPQVTKLIDSKNEDVRIAAIEALAVMGDASSVPKLAKAASAGGAVGDAATKALNRIKGKGIAEAMSRLIDSPDPAIRAGIIKVLTVRADRTMAPAMIKAAQDEDEKIRRAAMDGLAVVSGLEQLPDIVKLMLASDDASERSLLERALASAADKSGDKAARTKPIIAGLRRADNDAKARLVEVLGKLAGENALKAVRAQLKSNVNDVATAAVRALHQWPNPSPAPDLLKIIKTTDNRVHKVLAFRGYVAMANMTGERGGAETSKMYEQAMKLATSTAAKKSVLSGLANARSLEALRLAKKMMADKSLKKEAEVAVVQIAGNTRDAAPGRVKDILKTVIADTNNKSLRQKAQGIINEIDKYQGYITSWLSAGPYDAGFKNVCPPEKKNPKEEVEWKVLSKGVGAQVLNLAKAFGGNNRSIYLKTSVWSPTSQKVRLEIGSDDGVKVWVNGELAHANDATRGLRIAEDKADGELKKGWNEVLVKVAQAAGDWAFCLRFCKPDGAALDGLKVSIEGK